MLSVDELPFVEVTGKGFEDDPLGAFRRAREVGLMVRSSRGVEVLSNKLCQTMLLDRRLDSDHPLLVSLVGIPEGPVLEFKNRMLLGQGRNEKRDRIRKVMARHFGKGKVVSMRATVRAIVEDLLDDMEATGSGDVLNGLCRLLPARLYCAWIGAPKEDAALVSRLSDQVLKIFQQEPDALESILAGYEELFPYVTAQIERARKSPDASILSMLLGEADTGALSEEELFDFTCMLLEASTDNTSNQLALVLDSLMGDRQAWIGLAAANYPMADAVLECIRLRPRSVTIQRFVREDIELGGVHIPKGTVLNALVWAGSRDPEAIHKPDQLDIARPDAKRALTFGGGIFSCLGQHIAEIEMQEAVAAILRRYPTVRVRDFEVDISPFVATVTRLEIERPAS